MLARHHIAKHFQESNLLRTRTRSNSKPLSNQRSINMPLVVPGLQSTDGDKTSEWMNKLVGKKIGETSNETVSILPPLGQTPCAY